MLYRAATPPLPLTGSLVDDNWSFTLGWREMLVTAGQGAKLSSSTVPETDQSDMLRRYPDGYQLKFPSVTEAHFEVERGVAPAPAATRPSANAAARSHPFARNIALSRLLLCASH